MKITLILLLKTHPKCWSIWPRTNKLSKNKAEGMICSTPKRSTKAEITFRIQDQINTTKRKSTNLSIQKNASSIYWPISKSSQLVLVNTARSKSSESSSRPISTKIPLSSLRRNKMNTWLFSHHLPRPTCNPCVMNPWEYQNLQQNQCHRSNSSRKASEERPAVASWSDYNSFWLHNINKSKRLLSCYVGKQSIPVYISIFCVWRIVDW